MGISQPRLTYKLTPHTPPHVELQSTVRTLYIRAAYTGVREGKEEKQRHSPHPLRGGAASGTRESLWKRYKMLTKTMSRRVFPTLLALMVIWAGNVIFFMEKSRGNSARAVNKEDARQLVYPPTRDEPVARHLDFLVEWQFLNFSGLLTDYEVSLVFQNLRSRFSTVAGLRTSMGTSTFSANDSDMARAKCAHFLQILDGVLYEHSGSRRPLNEAVHKNWVPEFIRLLKYGLNLTEATIPNVEFAIETTDIPNSYCKNVPVFSYSRRFTKREDASIFLVPYFNFNNDKLMVEMIDDIAANAEMEVIDKTRTLLWRGSSTGVRGKYSNHEQYKRLTRYKLMELVNFPNGTSRYPDIDAKLTSFYAETPDALRPLLAPFMAPFLSLPEALKCHKFILDVEGNSWSDRFKFLVLGRVVILHQESPHIDFLAPVFEPGKDYLPIQSNLDDLLDVFSFAKA